MLYNWFCWYDWMDYVAVTDGSVDANKDQEALEMIVNQDQQKHSCN